MADPVHRIQQADAVRDPERLALKYRRMRDDRFAFLRATAHLFYAQLPEAAALRRAPAAWCCGDLHLENFGSYKGDNRLVYFDLNDFDEALLAPATWDPLRLAASLVVAREALGLKPKAACELAALAIGTWVDTLAEGHARWVERDTATGAVAALLERLRGRKRAEFIARRTEPAVRGRGRRLLTDGRHALPATRADRERVMHFFEQHAKASARPAFFRPLDVARRVAGVASLGVERWVVLVEGKGGPDGHYLVDLKQARPSALRKRSPCRQPAWAADAERVVAVQRLLQAIPSAFLQAVRVDGQSCVLRGLEPSEDRVALGGLSKDDLPGFVRTLAQCTAWAQLRASGRRGSANADELLDFARRRKRRTGLLEAALESAARSEADWRSYAEAFDDGVFAA
jgi:uncharacterized protein (DUF2252 family)